ncbi:NADH-dependent phenylglyoxylate dehydrogenase subunit gamma [Rhodospirillaceae bacterium LM-1]|nr:NADH-dependent phenylglyoxylate dehydrogenase subunit gamma [Rhodospirillaceae bacterium LM-1]
MASGLLAQAMAGEGRHVVAIPSFGFERRGAPVACFMRVDSKPIRAMTNIYKPDIILCIDPTVSRVINIFQGMAAGGILVQAGKGDIERLAVPDVVSRVGLCDAVSIALSIFKRPITNTVMLGAFARATGLVALDSLKAAIEEGEFRDAGLKQNLEAVERGFAETEIHELRAAA